MPFNQDSKTSRESLDRLIYISPNRILDIDHLLTLFGDISLIHSFFEVLIDELPHHLDHLKRLLETNESAEVHQFAHKLKSTFGWFNHNPSMFALNLLESISENTPSFVYKELMFILQFYINSLLSEMENELTNNSGCTPNL
jgi:hypothetical protein